MTWSGSSMRSWSPQRICPGVLLGDYCKFFFKHSRENYSDVRTVAEVSQRRLRSPCRQRTKKYLHMNKRTTFNFLFSHQCLIVFLTHIRHVWASGWIINQERRLLQLQKCDINQIQNSLQLRSLVICLFVGQAVFQSDIGGLLQQVGTGKESLSFMKRRMRRLASQWASAAQRLDDKLRNQWREQKRVSMRPSGHTGAEKKTSLAGVCVMD